MAYGYLKGESGIHRLVRISPFNAEGKRQTSFAAVDVAPEVSEQADVEIRDDEPSKSRCFAPAGPGGQHVNKNLQRRAADPSPLGHCGGLPERAESAQEPGHGDEDASRPAGPRRGGKARGRAAAKYNQMPKWASARKSAATSSIPSSRIKDARTGHSGDQFPQRAGRAHSGFFGRLFAI